MQTSIRSIEIKKDILICSLATLITILPYLINGLDYLTIIHDNLDANVVFFKSLASQGLFSFSPDLYMEGIMLNTIPRNNFPDCLKLNPLLFYFFSPSVAFLINLVFNKVLAVTSLFLITKDYVFKNTNYFFIAVLTTIYALLPTYSIYGSGNLCGFLFMLWASFKYLDTKDSRYLLVFILLPFTTSLIFFDLFALPISLLFVCFFRGFEVKVIRQLICPALLFIVFVTIANSNTLVSFFFPTEGFESHRLEFVKDRFSVNECLKNALKYFTYGFYHAPAAPRFIGAILVIYLVLKILRRTFDATFKILLFLFLCQIVFSLFFGFWFWEALLPLKKAIPILNVLDMTRLSFLSQPIWYLSLAFVIWDLLKTIKAPFNYSIATIILLIQLAYVYLNNREVQSNVLNALGQPYNRKEFASFNEFYLPETFEEIKEDFPDLSEFWTITVGGEPSVSRYNNLNVLDFYFANYDLDYKHQFESLINDELKEDEKLNQYFQNYGSRCYAFSSELFHNPDLNYATTLDLDYQWSVFKDMGGKYIISFYPIGGNTLALEKEYTLLHNPRYESIFIYSYK